MKQSRLIVRFSASLLFCAAVATFTHALDGFDPGGTGPGYPEAANGRHEGTPSLETHRISNGSIHVDDQVGRISSSSLSRSEGRITVGEGGGASRLDTSNGSIHFRIAG